MSVGGKGTRMRAVWQGTIAFGLVSIAVRLYAAVQDQQLRYHQVHRDDGGRIRHRRVCAVCDREVSAGDIIRAYPDPSSGSSSGSGSEPPRVDAPVLLADDDLAALAPPSARIIDVSTFVPAGEVDPVYYHRTYYVRPDDAGTKPYVLLRDAMLGTDRAAIAKITIRQREHPAVLRARGQSLLLHTMHWPDEIRAFEPLPADQAPVTVAPGELAVTRSLIDSMAGDFRPAELTDDYRTALLSLLDAEQEGHRDG